MGVSTSGVPCHHGRSLDDNDLLLSHCPWDFFNNLFDFGVALRDIRSHMGQSDDMMSLPINGILTVGCCMGLIFVSV